MFEFHVTVDALLKNAFIINNTFTTNVEEMREFLTFLVEKLLVDKILFRWWFLNFLGMNDFLI
jgi:hypothetical protein